MLLGIRNFGRVDLKISNPEGTWKSMIFPHINVTIGEEHGATGNHYILGEKPRWWQIVYRAIMRAIEWARSRLRKQDPLSENNNLEDEIEQRIRVQLNNKGLKSVIVYLGNMRAIATLLPGSIDLFEADEWIQVRELPTDPFLDLESSQT